MLAVVAVVAVIALLTGVVLGMLIITWSFSNHGEVKGIGLGVYQEDGVTTLTDVDWGYPEHTSISTVLGWIENKGNTPAVITTTVSNPSPEDMFDVALGWATFACNLTGVELAAYEKAPCEFTLTLFSAPEYQAFSFDVYVQAQS